MAQFSKLEIKQLIEATAEETVATTLRGLGVNVDEPLEVQRDFQVLHEWRVSMEKVRTKALLTAVAVIIPGILAALYLGIKSFLR